MSDTVVARIEKVGASYHFYVEGLFGDTDHILLTPVQGGFEPLSRPRGYGDLLGIDIHAGGQLWCRYSDGSEYIATRKSSVSWEVLAPLPPPPTLDPIPNQVMVRNRTKTIPIKFTRSRSHTWEFNNITYYNMSISGNTLTLRTGGVPGTWTLRVTIRDYWGRTASRTFRLTIVRPPTLSAIANLTVVKGKTLGLRKPAYSVHSGPATFTISVNRGGIATAAWSGPRPGFITRGVNTGTARFTMTLTDQWGQKASRSWNVTVTNPASGWRWPFPFSAITPGRGFGGGHWGIDFGFPPATNGAVIKCIGPGTVDRAGVLSGMSGNAVRVNHGVVNGRQVYSYYLHMIRTPPVRVGQKVDSTTTLGHVGNTGNSFGAHLHLELTSTGWLDQGFDPVPFMRSVGAKGA